MATPAAQPLGYAAPTATPVDRLAWVGLGLVVASVALTAAAIALIGSRVLPQHILCCRYPGVTFLLAVALPLAGAVAGLTACSRIATSGGARRGLWVAAPATAIGFLLVPLGLGLLAAMKA